MKTQAATLKNEVSGACALPAEPLLSIRLLLPETGLGELFLLGKRLLAYHAIMRIPPVQMCGTCHV